MRKNIIHLLTLLLVSGICLLAPIAAVQAIPLTQSDSVPEIDRAIWEAIQQEIARRPEYFLFEVYDWELSQVTYSADQTRAVVWLDPIDPQTGMVIATEPMTVLVELTSPKLAGVSTSWRVAFQGDEGWNNQAEQVLDLLPEELAVRYQEEIKITPGSAGGAGWLQTALGG